MTDSSNAPATPDGRARLPSAAEVRACTNFLSAPGDPNKVVRFSDDVVAKYGRSIRVEEAAKLEFVAANTSCPVPKSLGAYTDADTGEAFVFTQFVPGTQLGKLWPTLNPAEKADVADQLRAALQSLRQLPAPGYLGDIGRRPHQNGLLGTGDDHPPFFGPFDDEHAFNEGLVQSLERDGSAPRRDLLRMCIQSLLHGHKTYYTHGDLQPKNIIVQRLGSKEDGNGVFQIRIIDWEGSGWYPEYWDFCVAAMCAIHDADHLEIAMSSMQIYAREYPMYQYIHQSFYC